MRRTTMVLSPVMALLALALVGSALAGGPGAGTCSGGAITPGSYRGFTVTGVCWFTGDVTIHGNLFLTRGAILNDHAMPAAVVHVTGNVIVGKDAVLGLGTYGPLGGGATQTGTVVDGNITAIRPLSLYLSAITVHGNLTSLGGSGTGRNFPIKDNVIDGNLLVQGWNGDWIGLLGNQVGGNVIFARNSSATDPDSSEVAENEISGNLICFGNTPAAQIGDAGPLGRDPNVVGGRALGECASLVQH